MPNESDREIPLADASIPADVASSDPNDEVPVPIVMTAAEIDERAKVVEALRGNAPPPPPIDGGEASPEA